MSYTAIPPQAVAAAASIGNSGAAAFSDQVWAVVCALSCVLVFGLWVFAAFFVNDPHWRSHNE